MLAGLEYGEHISHADQGGEGRAFTEMVVGLSYWARMPVIPA